VKLQATAIFISAAMLSSAVGAVMGEPAFAAQEATEVAVVEHVSGRVLAFLDGKPTLLETLDGIGNGTQLDLQANSELRICHYQTRQFLTLKGPLRVSISRERLIALANNKTITAAGGSCAPPVSSTFSGGIVFRGLAPVPVSDISGNADTSKSIAGWQ
jgi:hypothetical protein